MIKLAIISTILFILERALCLYKEGMIFLHDNDPSDKNKGNGIGGVYEHEYAKEIYHTIPYISWVLVAPASICWWEIWRITHSMLFWIPYVLGILLVSWQVAETGYNISRYKKMFANYENFWATEAYNYRITNKHTLAIIRVTRTILGMIFIGLSVMIARKPKGE